MGLHFPFYVLVIINLVVLIFLWGWGLAKTEHGYRRRGAVWPMAFHFFCSLNMLFNKNSEPGGIEGFWIIHTCTIIIFICLFLWGDKDAKIFGIIDASPLRLRGSEFFGILTVGLVLLQIYHSENITLTDYTLICTVISISWMIFITSGKLDTVLEGYNNLKKALRT